VSDLPVPVPAAVTRTDPLLVAPERPALEGWLEFRQATLLSKCAGLTGEQLVLRSCPPSALSLLGLVRHLTQVERGWFLRRWIPGIRLLHSTPEHPDADFDDTDPAHAAADVAAYAAALVECRAEAARHDLDEQVPLDPDDPDGPVIDVRWIYLHMIEEYARHNGHADLLRQAIDDITGS
jgi:hypothetical protein